MEISSELHNLINNGKRELECDQKGELILPIRRKIWLEFGNAKFKDGNRVSLVTIGLKRRVKLAELCLKKVLDIWYNEFPNDNRPKEMVELANEYLKNKKTANDILLDKNYDKVSCDIENFESLDNKSVTRTILRISEHLVILAIHEDVMFKFNLNENSLDMETNPHSWDVGFLSSIVYSGSVPWRNIGEHTEKRREFWIWYLEKAVPEAYLSYSE